MSSSLLETEAVAKDDKADETAVLEDGDETPRNHEELEDYPNGGRIMEFLEEEKALVSTAIENGVGGHGYKNFQRANDASEDESLDRIPRGIGSPTESVSIPDDTPSVHVWRPPHKTGFLLILSQGSVLSSPGSSILPSVASRPGLGSPTPSFRPFDRRFQSRLTPSPLNSRASSPAVPTAHSRQVSISSQLGFDSGDADTPSPPWEVVRWVKLKKLNGQAFSEIGKRNFGTPTCISVSASVILGTSKGIILIFDSHQNLKSIIGPGTKGK
jgi:hypothetical protein